MVMERNAMETPWFGLVMEPYGLAALWVAVLRAVAQCCAAGRNVAKRNFTKRTQIANWVTIVGRVS